MKNSIKKSAIVKAAQNLFSQFGLKKVTTDEIAREARVSKATVYKYFSDKHDIFREVVELETEVLLGAVEKAVAGESTVEGRLKAHLRTKLEKIHGLINFYRVTRQTWGEHWPYIEEIHNDFMLKEKAIVERILKAGVDSGELSVKSAKLTAHIIVVAQKSLEYPWAMENPNLDIPTLVETMQNILLYGLKRR